MSNDPLERCTKAYEEFKIASKPRGSRAQSVANKEVENQKTMEYEVRKNAIIGPAPTPTPYVDNDKVDANVNEVLRAQHDREEERKMEIYKYKVECFKVWEDKMEDKINTVESDLQVAIGNLREQVENKDKDTNQKLKKEINGLRKEIEDLKNKTNPTTEMIADEVKKVLNKLPNSKSAISSRSKAELNKENYYREQSKLELVIRGIAKTNEDNPLPMIRDRLKTMTTNTFKIEDLKHAQWKGQSEKMEEIKTLVVKFNSEQDRDKVYDEVFERFKDKNSEVYVRKGICPSDRKGLEACYRRFDEHVVAGRIEKGTKISIKGGNGHYWLAKTMFKNVQDAELEEEAANGVDNKDNENEDTSDQSTNRKSRGGRGGPRGGRGGRGGGGRGGRGGGSRGNENSHNGNSGSRGSHGGGRGGRGRGRGGGNQQNHQNHQRGGRGRGGGQGHRR